MKISPVLIVACILMSSSIALATEQVEDTLIIGTYTKPIRAAPLEAYFSKSHPRPERLFSQNRPSNCWRGYSAEWELKKNRLWLNRITLGCSTSDLPLRKLFRGADGPVEADWFSGKIPISIHGRRQVLEFKKGRLMSRSQTMDELQSVITVVLSGKPEGATVEFRCKPRLEHPMISNPTAVLLSAPKEIRIPVALKTVTTCTVDVTHPGYVESKTTFKIRGGVRRELSVELEKAPQLPQEPDKQETDGSQK